MLTPPPISPRHALLVSLLAALPPGRAQQLAARIAPNSDLAPVLTSLPLQQLSSGHPSLPQSQPTQLVSELPKPTTTATISPASVLPTPQALIRALSGPAPNQSPADAYVASRGVPGFLPHAHDAPPFWIALCLLPASLDHNLTLAPPTAKPLTLHEYLTRLGLLTTAVALLYPPPAQESNPPLLNYNSTYSTTPMPGPNPRPNPATTDSPTYSHPARCAQALLICNNALRPQPPAKRWWAAAYHELAAQPSRPPHPAQHNITSTRLAIETLALLWDLLPKAQSAALTALAYHTLPLILSARCAERDFNTNSDTLARPAALRAATLALEPSADPW